VRVFGVVRGDAVDAGGVELTRTITFSLVADTYVTELYAVAT
jgi:hypothetical protein